MEIAPFLNDPIQLRDLIDIVRLSVAIVFAFAGLAKIASFGEAVVGVAAYGIVPRSMSSLVVQVLIVGEIAIAVSHFSGRALQWMAFGALVLLTVFFLIVLRSLMRGDGRPCLCFGAARGALIGISNLVRIGLLAICEIVLLVYLWGQDNRAASVTEVDVVFRNSLGVLVISMLSVAVLALFFSGRGLRRAWHIVNS